MGVGRGLPAAVLLLILVAVANDAVAEPVVGGAGWSLLFDKDKFDVLHTRLPEEPMDSISVELWVKLPNRFQEAGAVLSYATRTVVGNEIEESPHELLVVYRQSGWHVHRGSVIAVCSTTGAVECGSGGGQVGEWTHVAFTVDNLNGETSFYMNGELAHVAGHVAVPPMQGGGVLILGQQQVTAAEVLVAGSRAEMMVDELRLWSLLRTAAQVRDGWRRRLGDGPPGLLLAYRFDTPPGNATLSPRGAEVEPDDSRADEEFLLDGFLGDVPAFANVAEWMGLGKHVPTAPERVPSGAGLLGGEVVAPLSPGTAREVELRSWNPTGASLYTTVSRLPANGYLHQIGRYDIRIATGLRSIVEDAARNASHRVVYVPGAAFAEARGDSFEYTVADDAGVTATATVVLVAIEARAPRAAAMATDEDTPTSIVLGGTGPDGADATVVVTELPAQGRLYRGTLLPGSTEANLTADPAREIVAAPADVADEHGLLVYHPEPGMSYATNFSYAWRLGAGAVSPPAPVAVAVRPVNDHPLLREPVEVAAPHGGAVEISVVSDDPDGSFLGVDRTRLRLKSPPAFGSLLQADGATPVGFEGLPTTMATPVGIPPYNASWGAAFSGQMSNCGACCLRQETCNPEGCGTPAGEPPCPSMHGHASNLIGEPALLSGARPPDSWVPPPPEMGMGKDHFVVVQLPYAFYAQAVLVAQFAPGGITAIRVAEEYAGNRTAWYTSWEGMQPALPATASASSVLKIFRPFQCGAPFRARYVRIEMDSSLGGGSLASVTVQGTLSIPVGELTSAGQDAVVYRAPAGVHIAEGSAVADMFGGAVFDCIDEGPPFPLRVGLPPPAPDQVAEAGVFDTQAIRVPFRIRTRVHVEVGAARAHLAAALARLAANQRALGVPESPPLGDDEPADVWVKPKAGSASDVFLYQGDGSPLSGGTVNARVGGMVRLSDPDHWFELVISQQRATNTTIDAWVQTRGVTYRLRLMVSSHCPDRSTITTCALEASQCPEGYDFSLERLVCVPWDTGVEGESESLLTTILVAVSVLAMAFVVACLCILRRYRRLDKQLQYMTNSKNKELDLTSPVLKVADFLERLSERLGEGRLGPEDLREMFLQQGQELQQLLLTSENLHVPDIRSQMLENNDVYSKDIANFLVENTTSHEADWVLRERQRKAGSLGMARAQSFNNAGGNFEDSFQEETASEAGQGGEGEGGEGGGGVGGLTITPEGLDMLNQCGSNFFLDMFLLGPLCGDRPLVATTMHLLRTWNLIRPLRLDERKLRAFLHRVELGYMDNPYHNKEHAADVVCRLAAILSTGGIAFDGKDSHILLLAAVLAAAVHDYQHPGTNNTYHVATETVWARQFNDQNVIENLSLFQALEMGRDPEIDFMQPLSKDLQRRLRSTIIQMVLGTDLSKHFEVMTQFKSKVITQVRPGKQRSSLDRRLSFSGPSSREIRISEGSSSSTASGVRFGDLEDSQKMVILIMALKVADIGHCAMPLAQHRDWTKRLEDEFFAQGDAEREENLAISPLMDRRKPGPCCGKNQKGFFDVIVIPMLENWSAVFYASEPLLTTARANLAYWEEEVYAENLAAGGGEGSLNLPAVGSGPRGNKTRAGRAVNGAAPSGPSRSQSTSSVDRRVSCAGSAASEVGHAPPGGQPRTKGRRPSGTSGGDAGSVGSTESGDVFVPVSRSYSMSDLEAKVAKVAKPVAATPPSASPAGSPAAAAAAAAAPLLPPPVVPALEKAAGGSRAGEGGEDGGGGGVRASGGGGRPYTAEMAGERADGMSGRPKSVNTAGMTGGGLSDTPTNRSSFSREPDLHMLVQDAPPPHANRAGGGSSARYTPRGSSGKVAPDAWDTPPPGTPASPGGGFTNLGAIHSPDDMV